MIKYQRRVECWAEGHVFYVDEDKIEYTYKEVEETGWGTETVRVQYAFCPRCRNHVLLEEEWWMYR